VRKPEAAPAPAPTPVAAAPMPAKESAKERRAREGREREARDREARTPPPPPPAMVVTGTVRLAVSPWGQVEVDGVASGAAPPLTELKLAEGSHRIVVRNGDFAPFVATINVVGGQTTSIRHKFGVGS
jgi:serine/threonine-protein kinase